jgi:tetratricopeptide (TPR) repeat protein
MALRVREDKTLNDKNWIPYVIEKVDGDRFWVGDQQPGWVNREEVVPLVDAPLYYSELIRKNPRDVWAYSMRAICWTELGELNKAIQDHTAIIRLKPSSSDAYYNRGVVRALKGDYEEAIEDYTEAIRLNPGDIQAYGNRGDVWLDKKEYDLAIKDFSEAIRLGPEEVMPLCGRAIAWIRKGEYDKAIADYSSAIRLDPRDGSLLEGRATALHFKGDYHKALAGFNEAIRLDRANHVAHNNLAWLLATCPEEELRDGQRAVQLATIACELTNWKSGAHLGTLAGAYAEQGDFEKAVNWQTKAIQHMESEDRERAEEKLALYKSGKPFRGKPKP